MEHVLLSLAVGLAATLASIGPAIALAWLLARRRFPGRAAVQALVLLPLVLPPVSTGFLLLELLGPRRPLGRALAEMGLPIAFHFAGAVVAAAVVGFPLLVTSVTLAIEAVDPRLEAISRTLGRGPLATLLGVTLPLAWPGITAGAVLAFARGLGEFGATIVLAGHVPGETDTIPLAIYEALERPGGEALAMRLSAASLALGCLSIVLAHALDRLHRHRLQVER